MGRDIFEPVVTIVAGVIAVAMVAVLVSRKANTAGVFASAGGAFSNILSAATAPVTGNSAAPNVNAGGSQNGLLGGAGGFMMGGGAMPFSLSLNG